MIHWEDIQNISIEDIKAYDYPDFVDAFLAYAEDMDGRPLTDEELDFINENYAAEIQMAAFESYLGI